MACSFGSHLSLKNPNPNKEWQNCIDMLIPRAQFCDASSIMTYLFLATQMSFGFNSLLFVSENFRAWRNFEQESVKKIDRYSVPSTFASEDLCNISKAATDTSIQVPILID
jgi:hypothetical protein